MFQGCLQRTKLKQTKDSFLLLEGNFDRTEQTRYTVMIITESIFTKEKKEVTKNNIKKLGKLMNQKQSK